MVLVLLSLFSEYSKCFNSKAFHHLFYTLSQSSVAVNIFALLQKLFVIFFVISISEVFILVYNRTFLTLINIAPYLETQLLLNRPAATGGEMFAVIMIIGMVAQMTIPQMSVRVFELTTIFALKNAYSTTSNAYNMALSDYGTPDNWDIGSTGNQTGLSNINETLTKYFRIAKNCGSGPGCFPDSTYKNLKGMSNFTNLNQDTNYTKFLLANGTSVAVTQLSADCSAQWGTSLQLKNVCAMVVMDVNGAKNPNTYGMDVFGFALTKFGLLPLGTASQSTYPFNGFCSLNSNANKTYENGLSCTAWALYNENMVYKDCTGLNWKGKTECKQH